MESKEENVIGLFFNNPTKEWRFEEILKEAKITRSKANKWLKQFIKEELIKRIKEKGKMPYYISNYKSYSYKNKKKLFALNKMYDSGFLNHLSSLPKAKTVIIFGSFARSDWYRNSDIDIFIYGGLEDLKLAKYEMKLHRDIQVFVCHNQKELNKFGEGLIRNIIKGNIVKGDIDFVGVGANA
ncbi:hypothetical protein CEE44_04185 [Candidatus Woesearchaeota archaeon B3_Woes]|nr:MAG: hypothetical protein CEE44_04185 [Candidatus Woesearchaeota archaeon B3_Woes]